MGFLPTWISRSNVGSDELPKAFPFSVSEKDFVAADVLIAYTRILTDVIRRTQGIPKEKQKLLWDNCLGSEVQDGLVTRLAKAMTNKSDLFVVYDPATEVLVEATGPQQEQIRQDYKARGESDVGVYITFKNYTRTDLIKIYSILEYCTIGSLSKIMRLAQAIQYKIKELRASVGLNDSADAKAQAVKIATGLSKGQDVMLDADDIIDTAKPDMSSTDKAMAFIDRKRSFYLGLPASYITGEAKNSMGDTGEGDQRKVEQGLEAYFVSIVQPVMKALFDLDVTFESEDFRQLGTALEALKTFDITSDEHLSKENKTLLVNKLFGLPDDTEGDEPDETSDPASTPPTPIVPAQANPQAG